MRVERVERVASTRRRTLEVQLTGDPAVDLAAIPTLRDAVRQWLLDGEVVAGVPAGERAVLVVPNSPRD